MWDRPALLNRAANGFYALAFLIFAYALVWIVVHRPEFGLREIELTGETRHVTHAQVEAIVGSELKGTFFTLNLAHLRRSFEKLPWIREVRLRRHWPDRLEVNVVEHVPLARWGVSGLVNVQGEVFEAAYTGKLPVFIGPPGTSREIAVQYEYFRQQLSASGMSPALVRMSARRAWQLGVEGGPTLELGRQDLEARLARYLDVHQRTVGSLKRRIDYVDLRYVNGFAVRIPELKGEAPQSEQGAAKGKRRRT